MIWFGLFWVEAVTKVGGSGSDTVIDLNRIPEGRSSKRWFAGCEESDIMAVAL